LRFFGYAKVWEATGEIIKRTLAFRNAGDNGKKDALPKVSCTFEQQICVVLMWA
jgi:hypothetical protein